jgi:uncharacterized protein
MNLESYSFVLLRRGPRAAEYDDTELERLQAAHLRFLDAMRGAGHLLLAGPFSDQPDATVRGFCLYRTDLETTRELTATDPSVQAGRMAVDVMTWWTQPDAVTFRPGAAPG